MKSDGGDTGHIKPCLIRACRAPAYFDMGETLFNRYIKPLIPTDIRFGERGVFYRKVDLDWALEEYLRRSGQSGHDRNIPMEETCESIPDCQNAVTPRTGRSTKQSSTGGRKLSYAKARAARITN
ncbi:phosphoribulokinase [Thiohalobacter thiocyanaticus]|uniref:Phosphoribulokinase n=1 Tax=Thiohalobacter thiocyanaticus TaxID=585455 RepID=A0A1Z4VQ82_9GAMM|nr:phosphoribulokinase [Thiohalobacter thiocyanaticus]